MGTSHFPFSTDHRLNPRAGDDLRMIAMTLLPFDDVIYGSYAGKEEDGPPSFIIGVDYQDTSNWEHTFRITRYGVFYRDEHRVEREMTIQDLWKFLRQIPRPPYSFCELDGEYTNDYFTQLFGA